MSALASLAKRVLGFFSHSRTPDLRNVEATPALHGCGPLFDGLTPDPQPPLIRARKKPRNNERLAPLADRPVMHEQGTLPLVPCAGEAPAAVNDALTGERGFAFHLSVAHAVSLVASRAHAAP